MMKLTPLSMDNLASAHDMLQRIFPEDPQALDHFHCSITAWPQNTTSEVDFSSVRYYLMSEKNNFIGVTGHYHYTRKPDESWLGWFGLVPEARGKNLGKTLLTLTEDRCRENGYRILRIWTTQDNKQAIRFYAQSGYKEAVFSEEFSNVLVFSKTLTGGHDASWQKTDFIPSEPAGIAH